MVYLDNRHHDTKHYICDYSYDVELHNFAYKFPQLPDSYSHDKVWYIYAGHKSNPYYMADHN